MGMHKWHRLGASRRLARLGIAVTAQVLETSYAAAGAAVPPLVARVDPDACLHLGLAPREQRTSRRKPDHAGADNGNLHGALGASGVATGMKPVSSG